MKLKTLRQECESCHDQFETTLNFCFPCFVKQNQNLIFPKKSKWEQIKEFSWLVLLTLPLNAIVGYKYGITMELLFIFATVYGSLLNNFVNILNRWF